jgi:hypothetical protein
MKRYKAQNLMGIWYVVDMNTGKTVEKCYDKKYAKKSAKKRNTEEAENE